MIENPSDNKDYDLAKLIENDWVFVIVAFLLWPAAVLLAYKRKRKTPWKKLAYTFGVLVVVLLVSEASPITAAILVTLGIATFYFKRKDQFTGIAKRLPALSKQYPIAGVCTVIIVIVVLLNVAGGISKDDVYGRYDYQKPETSSLLGASTSDGYISFYENGQVLLYGESELFGNFRRWGTYTVNEEKTSIQTVFDDGMGPFELKITTRGFTQALLNGSTLYVKNDKYSEDVFKNP